MLYCEYWILKGSISDFYWVQKVLFKNDDMTVHLLETLDIRNSFYNDEDCIKALQFNSIRDAIRYMKRNFKIKGKFKNWGIHRYLKINENDIL